MCSTFTSIFMQIKLISHLNGFARGLVFKMRQRATRKWPIQSDIEVLDYFCTARSLRCFSKPKKSLERVSFGQMTCTSEICQVSRIGDCLLAIRDTNLGVQKRLFLLRVLIILFCCVPDLPRKPSLVISPCWLCYGCFVNLNLWKDGR